jgi:hypothetical protein
MGGEVAKTPRLTLERRFQYYLIGNSGITHNLNGKS